MAGLDYGVITIKNKKILKDSTLPLLQGEGGYFSIGNAIFDRMNPTVQTSNSDDIWNDYLEYLTDRIKNDFLTISMFQAFDVEKKKVLYWNFLFEEKEVLVKTKEIYGFQVFTSSFSINGDHYLIIHGYDVSLRSFHSNTSKKLIRKLLKKNTNIY